MVEKIRIALLIEDFTKPGTRDLSSCCESVLIPEICVGSQAPLKLLMLNQYLAALEYGSHLLATR